MENLNSLIFSGNLENLELGFELSKGLDIDIDIPEEYYNIFNYIKKFNYYSTLLDSSSPYFNYDMLKSIFSIENLFIDHPYVRRINKNLHLLKNVNYIKIGSGSGLHISNIKPSILNKCINLKKVELWNCTKLNEKVLLNLIKKLNYKIKLYPSLKYLNSKSNKLEYFNSNSILRLALNDRFELQRNNNFI